MAYGDLLKWRRADPRQQHRTMPAPNVKLRLAEEGIVGRNGHVAGQRQFAGAGEGIGAAHRRNRSAAGNARSA